MATKSRDKRAQKDSVKGAMDAAASSQVKIDPPEGVGELTEAQRLVWDQFIATRSAQDWRKFDLVMLTKIVRLEVQIRDAMDKIEKTGLIVSNKRGTPVANPLIVAMDTLQRQQMTVIRGMGLMATGTDQRTIANAAKAENKEREVGKENNVSELFAVPK